MEAPLLLNGGAETHDDHADYAPVRSLKEAKTVLWIETVKVWRIAAPIILNVVCMYGTNSFTNIFVGHIGELELSAVSIATSVVGTFSFGFMLGMGSALETLCGQAFGAGQVHMLGIYLQRSWVILLVSCVILLPVYCFATPVLKLLGQEDDIAERAGKFTILLIPQLFSLALNFPTQKFLQAQSKVNVLAWIGFLDLLVHIAMLYVFIFVFGWGTTGAAIAYDLSSWFLVLAQLVYVWGWCKEGWHGFSTVAFAEIWPFFRLSLASAVMLCLEVWYTMSIIIFTGHLDNAVVAVGSLSICINLNGWASMVFIGLNAAVGVRVSNELGLGRPRAAKYSVITIVCESFVIGLFFMAVILLTRNQFAVIFTNSKQLQTAVAKLAYLLSITVFLNSVQPVLSGVAIGGGWQALVAYINIGSYYIFGLPFGYILGYTANLGVMGLWGGMICGIALQTLLLSIVLYRTNWTKEVEQTVERMQIWGGQDVTKGKIADSI
ncbi:hypothetical protein Ddye_013806 [Dipteronia dyeriana]|uniref:Protein DETOXIFICATION n=1 Tax=Dipteronia dyeriana TaxID=168575 RepID=A0AAE0CJZ4_9ROSI|nr:hypothetical protein Ddye_013806 [Dipteronia dyeriana]